MILHLLTDDKFTDYVIDQFSGAEMHSEYVVVPTVAQKGLLEHGDRCRIVRQNSPEFDELLDSLGQYCAIIIHGMTAVAWQGRILRAVPDSVRVAWVLWGGDIYGREDIFLDSLGSLSKALYLCRKLTKGKEHVRGGEFDLRDYARVDYILADEDEEFEFVRRYTGNMRMKQLWYAYYSVEKTVGVLVDKRVSGRNIWLGNSATVSQNFFEALSRLKRFGIGDCRLVMSIAYGSPWIKRWAAKWARFLFGKQVQLLTSYVPRDEYNQLMLDCGTMIMNQYVPQGHGNIVTGIWLGMRVYMSERSLAYAFFKRIGCHIFSFEYDFPIYRYTPMTDIEVEESRVALMKWYGLDHIISSAREVVRVLNM